MAKTLNPSQLSAITHKDGPLLIIAGAGTGKTTVISERIKFLIDKKHAKPQEILALTFTEKAATEMETRVDELMPLGFGQVTITTFHSFCDQILRQYALHIGLDSSYKLLSTVSSVSLFKKNLYNMPLNYFRPLGNPTKFITAILDHFSRLKDEDISPKKYIDWANSQDKVEYQELSQCYEKFEQIKIENSVMDFSDLISNCLTLLRTRPNILTTLQSKYKYLLVDEYQDTNLSQNKLLDLLMGKSKNITAVADDDQAIYKFRGAAVGNVMHFKSVYKPKLVVLTQNYRSTQTILDAAYKFISHNNPNRLEIAADINKKLVSISKNSGENIEIIHAPTGLDEADLVAQKISQILSTTHLALSTTNIAILVRANSHAQIFMQALSRHGISYQFLGPTYLYSQPEIKDLIALLQTLTNPYDDLPLFRLLQSSFYKFPQQQLVKLLSQSKSSHQPLFDLLPEKESQILKNLIDQSPSTPPSQLVYNFLELTGVLSDFLNAHTESLVSMSQNISKFLTRIKDYESENPDSTIQDVLSWIELSNLVGESPLVSTTDLSVSQASVSILTVHSSKGLEFSTVFLVNLVADRFPTRNRADEIPIPQELVLSNRDTDTHIEEERRLFYVGLTRAKSKLYLSYADFYNDGKRLKKPSPFISETLGSTTTHITKPTIHVPLPVTHNPISNYQLSTINYLTYSHIETFMVCPLHYKAKYILGLPTPPSASLTFGNTIHKTLKDFAETGKDIVQIYDSSWGRAGFDTPQHEQEYKKLGEKYLSDFVKKFPSLSPKFIEQSFKVPVFKDLTFGGRFDRIDETSDGKLHIIDYKTSSKPKSQKEADTDLQLSLYALAASIFFKKPASDILLSFYFFANQSFVTTTRTESQITNTRDQLQIIKTEIESSDFSCSKSILCQNCEYSLFCSTKTTL